MKTPPPATEPSAVVAQALNQLASVIAAVHPLADTSAEDRGRLYNEGCAALAVLRAASRLNHVAQDGTPKRESIIAMLIEVARTAHYAMDDAADGELDEKDQQALSDALDALDELPAIEDGFTRDGWCLAKDWLSALNKEPWNAISPAAAVGGEYDRDLIADMLDGLSSDTCAWSAEAIREQARLLREADNRDAACVHTAKRDAPPAGGFVVVTDMQEFVHPDYGTGLFCTMDAVLAASPTTKPSAKDGAEFPECSGTPNDCPENEGYGCCRVKGGVRGEGDYASEKVLEMAPGEYTDWEKRIWRRGYVDATTASGLVDEAMVRRAAAEYQRVAVSAGLTFTPDPDIDALHLLCMAAALNEARR